MTVIEIELPVIVVSESNRRDHHMVRYRRTVVQKSQVMVFCSKLIGKLGENESATITLTRLGKRMLDSGNLEIAFKAVQDAIASKRYPSLLGVDDADPRLTWVYKQEKAKKCIGLIDRNRAFMFGMNEDGTGIRIKIEVVE